MAALLGLIVLLAAAPSRAQLRAVLGGLLSGVLASACSAAFSGVASLEGTNEGRDGAVMLAILVVIMLVFGLVAARGSEAERVDPTRRQTLRYARRLPAVAAAAVLLCVVGLVVGGLGERPERREKLETSASRFASVNSRRFEYWRVGAQAFAEDPLKGLGAGGYRVEWRKERRVDEGVQEVHSVVLEMATELGVVGLVLLGLLLGGVTVAGRRALRSSAPIASGASAACTVWLVHAIVDWDLQLPAVVLPAVVLAGALLAASERGEATADKGGQHAQTVD